MAARRWACDAPCQICTIASRLVALFKEHRLVRGQYGLNAINEGTRQFFGQGKASTQSGIVA